MNASALMHSHSHFLSLIAHGGAVGWGFTFATRTYFQSNPINMYVKCSGLVDARRVFDEMTEQQVLLSWNVMIAAYQRHGYPQEALSLFHQMQMKPKPVRPDHFTFATILPACAKMGALNEGMEIHQMIIESGLLSDVVVANALMDMYAKCRNIHKARQLFDKTPQRNTVSWNTMIAGYAPNGVLGEASRLFKEMPHRNVVSWTAMIAAYTQSGLFKKAFDTFKQMQLTGVPPNSATFATILPACAKTGALEEGMEFHQRIIESGISSDAVLLNALIHMYAKCGRIHKAHKLFDKKSLRNVVSWNVMITGYAHNGLFEKLLETFKQMQSVLVNPDSTTFASVLPACAKMGTLKEGMSVHRYIIESGFLSDVVVVSALVDMYAKCGSIHKAQELFNKMSRRNVVSWTVIVAAYAQNGALDEALKLFEKMPERNVVSWTAMIAGYAQNGLAEKALKTFKKMQLAGVKPNSTTFVSILPACSKMGALEEGMGIHQSIMESGFLSDVVVVNSLIDMYAKCGSIQTARELFDKMSERVVVSWTAMIAGYALNGHGKDALKLFEIMKQSGVYPDHVSYICVLFACSHAGLVDEGCKYFKGMTDYYHIMPTMDHYACMIDLLGRAGYLEEALNFVINMPIKPAVVVWMCLLGACRSYKNIGLGVFTATLLFELIPKIAAPYVLLSDIYAEVSRWGDVQKVRRVMKDRGIKKIPGCSWIEVHKMVHAFHVGDMSHPQTQEIYAKLEKLSWEMKAAEYFPHSSNAMNDVEDEEKELFLSHHSEKLAIAFGLLNLSPGTTIRVVKNLRVCVVCHTEIKFISKIVSREIVVRDMIRFHHFKQGQCSCGDYW